jgi:hypothetical protein
MASAAAIRWIERLVWTLVYGGLFSAVIGIATRESDPASGWALIVVGGIIAVVGAVLVLVRSRMQADR